MNSEHEEAAVLANLNTTLHRRGVNLRHLGLLRSLCTQLKTRQLVTVEMAKRALKNELRALLRREILRGAKVSLHLVRGRVAEFLTVLMSGPESDIWMELPAYINSRYGDFCTDKSLQPLYKNRYLKIIASYLLDAVGLGLNISCRSKVCII